MSFNAVATRLALVAALAVLTSVPEAGAALKVVASTEDLADLARQVGGTGSRSRRSRAATRTRTS